MFLLVDEPLRNHRDNVQVYRGVGRRVSQMLDVHNVIIIGSGPAGYTAGLYAARAMLEPLMFAGYMSGGQLMLTSDIENFPGYPEGSGGPEMMM